LLQGCLAFIGIVGSFEEFLGRKTWLLVSEGYEGVVVGVSPEI
jgi:hypothetical protein